MPKVVLGTLVFCPWLHLTRLKQSGLDNRKSPPLPRKSKQRKWTARLGDQSNLLGGPLTHSAAPVTSGAIFHSLPLQPSPPAKGSKVGAPGASRKGFLRPLGHQEKPLATPCPAPLLSKQIYSLNTCRVAWHWVLPGAQEHRFPFAFLQLRSPLQGGGAALCASLLQQMGGCASILRLRFLQRPKESPSVLSGQALKPFTEERRNEGRGDSAAGQERRCWLWVLLDC